MEAPELTALEGKILSELREVQRMEPAKLISSVSLICVLSGQDLEGFSDGFTRGDFKRAIKEIRSTQAEVPELAVSLADAVSFIRRVWLKCTGKEDMNPNGDD